MYKKILFIVIFAGLQYSQAGGKFPGFRLKDLNNQTQTFSKLKGEKLTVVDFWATWCKPCARALPKLNMLYERYAEEGTAFIGINVDSPRNSSKVKPFANSYKIKYPIVRDPNSSFSGEVSVNSFPTLFIINSNNEIIYIHQGYKPGDEKLIEKEIRMLLKLQDN